MSINQLAKIAGKHVGKSPSTIKGWYKEGLDISDLRAVKAFSDKKDLTSCGRARTNAIARRHAERGPRQDDVQKAQELVSIDPGSESSCRLKAPAGVRAELLEPTKRRYRRA
jgi:hypothetical protein